MPHSPLYITSEGFFFLQQVLYIDIELLLINCCTIGGDSRKSGSLLGEAGNTGQGHTEQNRTGLCWKRGGRGCGTKVRYKLENDVTRNPTSTYDVCDKVAALQRVGIVESI